jgi:thymidylate synthase
MQDIIDIGEIKETRAGKTRSLFGKQLRFNLKDGLPMLTTKKMFSKGVIHELLWFIKGDTNIKYLVDNGVHIWDDDAYRYYIELTKEYRDGLSKIYDKDTFFKNG